MIIDERIFNELEKVDLHTDKGMDLLIEYGDAYWDSMTPDEQRAYCEGNGIEYDEDDTQDAQDACVEDIIENAIGFYYVPKDSLLEAAIFTYGRVKGYGNLYDTYAHLGLIRLEDDNFYFTTGLGYDVIDSDLLGGDASGETKREFLKIVNEND